MASRVASRVLLVAAALSSTGCLGTFNGLLRPVGPDYCPPMAPVGDRWIDAEDPRVASRQEDYSQWWSVFEDPELDGLIGGAYSQNLPLRVAGLRVLEARALADVARGNWFPQVQERFGSYERTQLSSNVRNNALAEKNFNQWQTGFNVAWELDFWGRFRRAIEAADAEWDASIENYDDVLVILLAEVAGTYVEIRTVQRQIQYARDNVESQQISLDLAEVRFRNGAVTELDVRQAESNLAQTESIIPPLRAALRQAQNRLAVLLGMPPQYAQGLLGGPKPIPTAPPEVAVGIPADLLRRRPDVRRAEREAAAQSARIGIAASDLYPQFFLSGFIGYNANSFNDLSESASSFGSVAPGFTWKILNYGRIANNILAQDARFQQLVVQYQETVLQANAEVEDNLVAFLESQQQARALNDSVIATSRSVELAVIQYREGAIEFDRVVNLQSLLTVQQDQLAASQGSIAANLIRVYKALGGGWEIRLVGPVVRRLPNAELDEPEVLPPLPPAEEMPAPQPG